MHERTQRALAQLLFVVCCAVPTLITIVIIGVTRSPWYHRGVVKDFEQDISTQIGTQVSVESLRTLSPTQYEIGGMKLLEPETGREILRVANVDWRQTESETALVLHQPELRAAQLKSAWRLFHDRFLRHPDRTQRPLQFAANDLTIHSAASSMTLRDVDAAVFEDNQSITANVQAILASAEDQLPILINVTRDRTGAQPTTIWTINTGGTSLPCSALADYLPEYIAVLGPEATFTGTMRFAVNEEGWTLDLGGCRFDKVALDRLFEKQSHRISGTASIELQKGLIQPGQRMEWLGTMRAQEGALSQSLLAALNEHLGVEIAQIEGDGDVTYQQLSMRFELFDTQLMVQGICDTEPGYGSLPPYIMICGPEHAIARAAPQQLPALRLASFLSNPANESVGINDRNRWLVQWLVPARTPIHGIGASRPKLRVATEFRGDQSVIQPH
jgi:hypothetical protein